VIATLTLASYRFFPIAYRGPLALATGLALPFVLTGLFVATVGYSIGLNADLFRNMATALIIVFDVVLVVPASLGTLPTTRRPAVVATQFCLGGVVGGHRFHPAIDLLAHW
jgi:hypothetical protein